MLPLLIPLPCNLIYVLYVAASFHVRFMCYLLRPKLRWEGEGEWGRVLWLEGIFCYQTDGSINGEKGGGGGGWRV